MKRLSFLFLFLFLASGVLAYQLPSINYTTPHAGTAVYAWTNTASPCHLQSVYFHSPTGATNTFTLLLRMDASNTFVLATASSTNMFDVVFQADNPNSILVQTNWSLEITNSVYTNFTVIINRDSAQ